jgi:ribosome-associated protein
MLVVNHHVRIPKSEFQWSFVRSSGPGGQNVNKVASKAVLRWDVLASPSLSDNVRRRFLGRYGNKLTSEGQLIVSSQRYRDQGRNVDDALEKLREMLASVAVAPKRRRATRPTKASVTRRIETKQSRSRTKKLRRRVDDD